MLTFDLNVYLIITSWIGPQEDIPWENRGILNLLDWWQQKIVEYLNKNKFSATKDSFKSGNFWKGMQGTAVVGLSMYKNKNYITLIIAAYVFIPIIFIIVYLIIEVLLTTVDVAIVFKLFLPDDEWSLHILRYLPNVQSTAK